MRKHTTILIVTAAFALGGLASAFALLAPKRLNEAKELHAVWHEVDWPFPMDQWGTGKAFRCGVPDCGAEVTVYLRAKIGFCNCTGGLATDDELDRISDFDLFGGALYPQAPGAPIKASWMKGRGRPSAIRDATMLSVGLHDNCDALVATAVMPRGTLGAMEPAVQQFLDSQTFKNWAETTLGL